MEDYLSGVYYNPRDPASFSSLQKLYRKSQRDGKNYSVKEIKAWLQQQETFTRHKAVRRRYRRSRVMTYGINYLWQADLVDIQKLARYNKGHKYILTVIDTFSKKAWAIPMKRKAAEYSIAAFKEVFKDGVPKYLQFDEGTEFLNRTMKELLASHNIHYYSTASEVKASIVERFNRTLKTKMFKYFTYKNTLDYVTVLQELVDGYNASVHRSTGFAPNNVNEENADVVFKKLYPKKLYVTARFAKGDQVRISINKRPVFDKGYTPNYTMEIFTVDKVVDGIPATYRLKEYNGDPIKGTFYNEELVKVIIPGDSYFKIEKILKTRTRHGKKEYFVSWIGYDASYNSWTTEVKEI